MKAIVLKEKNTVELKEIPQPEKAAPEHLLIKMEFCGINSGDKLLVAGEFPIDVTASRHNIAGVSGVGTVLETGQSVPDYYKGKKVAVYRSLKFGYETAGTWSEYAHLHYLNCTILPDNVNTKLYSGSLVNVITPYTFLKQIEQEGHKGIICTAGNSATGIAMLGFCLTYNFSVISIVRTEAGKKELEALGAKNILVQSDNNFRQQLNEISQQLSTTAIFDGAGGATLSNIIDAIPFNSAIYSYGFMDKTPLSFNTRLLMRGITIKGFSNFKTQTVQNRKDLEQALTDISRVIHQPHFTTKIGQEFAFEEISQALNFSSSTGGKAILHIK